MSANVNPSNRPAGTSNQALLSWVDEMAKLTKPDRVVWCDGSEEEKKRLTEEAVAAGMLDPAQSSRSCPAATSTARNPNDVARVEHLTFICTPTKDEAGPTNNWMAPDEAYAKLGQALRRLDEGPHDVRRSRTSWARSARRSSKVGIELTDSVYVVAQHADHDAHGEGRARHARRLATTSTAACTRTRRRATPSAASSATSPRTTRSGRVGSGYGGNALLGKKCLALRIGSYLGTRRGLARRAHAHPRRREPRGRDDLRRRARSRAPAARPTSR